MTPANIPPFVIHTHQKDYLNAAVQRLCFAAGFQWWSGKSELRYLEVAEQIEGSRGNISFSKTVRDEGKDHRRFDAETDLAAFAEFLHNPPKPEPVARPWTAEEVPLGKEVRMKERPAMRGLIIAITADGNVTVSWYGVISPKELFTYWTLADGAPCGTTDPA